MKVDLLADYEGAARAYAENWQATDDTLYELCRQYPDHSHRNAINAKLWVIGRTYATGIERKILTRNFQGSSMEKLADHFFKNGKQLDRLFSQLKNVREPMTVAQLGIILDVHGQLVNLIKPILRPRQTPRSFASKYLHFHCPAVPIYDSVAAREINGPVRWNSKLEVIPLKPPADSIYHRYVMRFWALFQRLRASGANVTVKKLDAYLLSLERQSGGQKGQP